MSTEERVDVEQLFPPHVLRQYALLADGERGALIGPQGDIVWMCAPRWDSEAVFSTLIGGGGVFAVTPQNVRHVWGGCYEAGSLIWRSRWITDGGVIECREALAFPGDSDRVVLLRRIIAVRGDARVRVVVEPRSGFGRHGPGALHQEAGVWSGRSGRLRWRLTGAEAAESRKSAQPHGELLMAELTVPAGEHHDLVFEVSEQSLPEQLVNPTTAWSATEAAWSRSVPDLASSIAPHDAQHAYAVLRGLTSSGGGMVAAATMSLPERAGQCENYDYRYAWIRDQSYAGMAAASAGAPELLDAAVGFVSARLLEDGPQLKPAYTVTGGAVPDEQMLNLSGYPGASVKTGTGSTASSSSTHSAKPCNCWPLPGAPTGSVPTAVAQCTPPSRPSPPGTPIRRRGSGNWTTGAGPSPGWPAWPGCARWRHYPTLARTSPSAPPWPTRCSPTPPAAACTLTGTGNAPRTIRAWTPPCCCPRCAVHCPRRIPAPWPLCAQCKTT